MDAEQQRNPQLSAKAGASDIVQQTLLNAAEEFQSFRGTTLEQFRGWLRQILINEIRGLNRRFTARRRNVAQELELDRLDSGSQFGGVTELADDLLTPSRQLLAEEESEALKSAKEKLPAEMRQVIQLRNWERLQFHEIAERMGISLSSAAKLWYRALVELQRLHTNTDSHEQA